MENNQNVCKCHHHKVMPLLIVLFGLAFLLGQWGALSWDSVNVIWPVLVIVAGLMKFTEKSGMCKCC